MPQPTSMLLALATLRSTLPCPCHLHLPAILLLALLSSWGASPAAAQQPAYDERLPVTVARALKTAGIAPSAVAIVVQEANGVIPRVSVNAGVPMNPASVMKLVTTYAALELLGPAWTWQTTALIAPFPPITDGMLDGDLHLVGSGDPKLTFEQFWLLLRQLRARGLREIRGDLVLDRRAFAATAHDEAAFDGQPLRPYNVGPDALLLNFKALRLTLLPANQAVTVLPEPAPANLDIINRLEPVAGPCPGGNEWRNALRADGSRHGENFRLTLTGSYPAACGEQTWHLGMLPHPHYVFGVFRQLWAELGGSLKGGVRDGPPPPGARPLASIESPALTEIVRDINKHSNNVMARQLFLTLGQKAGRSPPTGGGVTTAQADEAVRGWLAAKSLHLPELVLDNGSGLSRRERISAESTARLLASAWKSPMMPELMSSLPLLAVDGTLKKRLNDGSAAGQVHAKTGSLEGVKTLAGYVLDKSGRYQIVVFFVNHPNAAAAQAAQDALLQWVFERAP